MVFALDIRKKPLMPCAYQGIRQLGERGQGSCQRWTLNPSCDGLDG